MPVATTLTDTQGIVALAAAGAAALALIFCLVLALYVRRIRRDQRAVLGGESRDLVAHAAETERAFQTLAEQVQATSAALEARMSSAENALRGTISHSALVRYDAYNDLSGRQSMSIALLDDDSSGVVISCILHRDQARVYGKQVLAGQGELELSPEEAEAVRLALSDGKPGGGAAP